jgi:nitrous oxidase accessory protein NosD
VAASGDLKLRYVVITGHSGYGIHAVESTQVGIARSTISNNIHGVVARGGSSVIVRNTSINGNDDNGIVLLNNSTGTVNKSIISGNSNGIAATAGTVLIENNTIISDNADHGIEANFHSSVQVSDSAIINNGAMGIKLEYDSGLLTFDNVAISGNGDVDVFCSDTESSFQDSSPTGAEVECTDFNQFIP